MFLFIIVENKKNVKHIAIKIPLIFISVKHIKTVANAVFSIF